MTGAMSEERLREIEERAENRDSTVEDCRELLREVRRLRAAQPQQAFDYSDQAIVEWANKQPRDVQPQNAFDKCLAICTSWIDETRSADANAMAQAIAADILGAKEASGAASEEWVAVEERLPLVGGTYWVHAFAKNPFVPGSGFCAVGYYVIFEDGGKWSVSGTWPDETLDRVMHWRELARPPLPQPPGSSPKEGK